MNTGANHRFYISRFADVGYTVTGWALTGLGVADIVSTLPMVFSSPRGYDSSSYVNLFALSLWGVGALIAGKHLRDRPAEKNRMRLEKSLLKSLEKRDRLIALQTDRILALSEEL